MKTHFKIEGIPAVPARIYSDLVVKNPFIRSVYRDAAGGIAARVSSGRVLDVGTGPGSLPFEIVKLSSSLTVVGIDISPEMVRIAQSKAAGLGFSDRAQFQVADAANLPFPDNSFDLTVSTLSLHHWSKPAEALAEICRVTRQGGEAWVYDLRRDIPREAAREFRARYSRLVSFLVLHVVRRHSSITLEVARYLLASPSIACSGRTVEEHGILLKLRLVK